MGTGRKRGPLRAVADAPTKPEPPDMSYEWQHRQRVRERNWRKLHEDSNKAEALPWSFRLRSRFMRLGAGIRTERGQRYEP